MTINNLRIMKEKKNEKKGKRIPYRYCEISFCNYSNEQIDNVIIPMLLLKY